MIYDIHSKIWLIFGEVESRKYNYSTNIDLLYIVMAMLNMAEYEYEGNAKRHVGRNSYIIKTLKI